MSECNLTVCKHVSDLEAEIADARRTIRQSNEIWAAWQRKCATVVEAATDLLNAWDNKRPLAWQPDGHQDLLRALRKAVDTANAEHETRRVAT